MMRSMEHLPIAVTSDPSSREVASETVNTAK